MIKLVRLVRIGISDPPLTVLAQEQVVAAIRSDDDIILVLESDPFLPKENK